MINMMIWTLFKFLPPSPLQYYVFCIISVSGCSAMRMLPLELGCLQWMSTMRIIMNFVLQIVQPHLLQCGIFQSVQVGVSLCSMMLPHLYLGVFMIDISWKNLKNTWNSWTGIPKINYFYACIIVYLMVKFVSSYSMSCNSVQLWMGGVRLGKREGYSLISKLRVCLKTWIKGWLEGYIIICNFISFS